MFFGRGKSTLAHFWFITPSWVLYPAALLAVAAWLAASMIGSEARVDIDVSSIEPESGYAYLAERVLHILDDPEWAAKARQRGPAFVSERFGIRRMIEETLDVYGMEAPGRRVPARPGPGQIPDG